MKRMRTAKEAGDTEAAKKAAEETTEQVERLASLLPTREQIANRARGLWEQAGKPSGRDEELWHTAENQLLREAREKSPVNLGKPGQSVEESTAEAAAEQGSVTLTDKQKEQFIGRIGRARDDGGEASFVPASSVWNTARTDSPEQALTMLDELAKLDGGTQTLREIEQGAEWIGREPARLVQELSADAERVTELTKRFVAGKNLMHDLSAKLVQQAEAVKATSDKGEMLKFLQMQDTLATLERNLLAVRKGSARTTSAGRIVTGPSRIIGDVPLGEVDLAKLDDVIDRAGGVESIQEMATRAAASENPGQLIRSLRQS